MTRPAALHVPTDPAKLGYLAALLDGEGNVGITRAKPHDRSKNVSHACYIGISNTSMALMEWLLREVGGNVTSTGHRTEQCREGFVWKLYGKKAGEFLVAVEPHVVIKADQVAVALEFLALGSGRKYKTGTPQAIIDRREELRERMLALNRKGPQATEGLARDGNVLELRYGT